MVNWLVGTMRRFAVECLAMMKSKDRHLKALKIQRRSAEASHAGTQRAFTLEEVRLIADLRIMHAKVDELYQISKVLQTRHDERAVVTHADKAVLAEDIRKVDELYIWFVELRDETDRSRRKQVNGH